ncbi:MAG: hypothetical protein V4584_09810 [Verrucomicrobiota bacterium]
MLLLSRLATALVIFVVSFVTIYLAICVVGGGIAGGAVGAANPNSSDVAELGRQAGQKFVGDNLTMITLSSLGVSSVLSLVLSFSGILPWCKKRAVSPYL